MNSIYAAIVRVQEKLEESAMLSVRLVLLLICMVNTQAVDQYDPVYIGRFKQPIHSVGGDIFILDEQTVYIQDFSHDGQAPDVFFWADGVIIPYITRTDLTPRSKLERFLPREDVLLNLPKGMTVYDVKELTVWCRAFGISFGSITFPNFKQL